MKRTLFSVFLVGSLVFGASIPATSSGIGVTVQVRDDLFDPEVAPPGDPLTAGESVKWEWAPEIEAPHDVRQLRGLFRSPLSSEPGTIYLRDFSAGRFPYECSIHGPFMSGVVRVQLWQGAAPSGLPVMRWAFPDSNTGTAFDVQFRVGGGPWRVWKKDTTRLLGVFGRNDRPVHFNPGREYSFRARSQKRVDTPTRVSKWSPVTPFD
jgi:hypothetical protein